MKPSLSHQCITCDLIFRLSISKKYSFDKCRYWAGGGGWKPSKWLISSPVWFHSTLRWCALKRFRKPQVGRGFFFFKKEIARKQHSQFLSWFQDMHDVCGETWGISSKFPDEHLDQLALNSAETPFVNDYWKDRGGKNQKFSILWVGSSWP